MELEYPSLNALIKNNDVESIIRMVNLCSIFGGKLEIINHVLIMKSLEYFEDLEFAYGDSISYTSVVRLDEEERLRYDSDDDTGEKSIIINEWEECNPHLDIIEKPIDTDLFDALMNMDVIKSNESKLSLSLALHKAFRCKNEELIRKILSKIKSNHKDHSAYSRYIDNYYLRSVKNRDDVTEGGLDTDNNCDSNSDSNVGPGMIWKDYRLEKIRSVVDDQVLYLLESYKAKGITFNMDKHARHKNIDRIGSYNYGSNGHLSHQNWVLQNCINIMVQMEMQREKERQTDYIYTPPDNEYIWRVFNMILESDACDTCSDFKISYELYKNIKNKLDEIDKTHNLSEILIKRGKVEEGVMLKIILDKGFEYFKKISTRKGGDLDEDFVRYVSKMYLSKIYHSNFPLYSDDKFAGSLFGIDKNFFDMFVEYTNKKYYKRLLDVCAQWLMKYKDSNNLEDLNRYIQISERSEEICEFIRSQNTNISNTNIVVTISDFFNKGVPTEIVDMFKKYGFEVCRSYHGNYVRDKDTDKSENKSGLTGLTGLTGFFGLIAQGVQDRILTEPCISQMM